MASAPRATLAAPREDRYRLLRATGVNTSPVVGLFEDRGGGTAALLAEVARRAPLASLTDDDGVHHRLWAVTDDGAPDGAAATLAGAAGAGPVFIADGHHRYETALRYRDERQTTRSSEQDPPYDFLLMLFLDAADELTVLPTHRVVRGLGEEGLAHLRDGLDRLFEVTPGSAEPLVARHDAAGELPGRGPDGLVTRDGAWQLVARRRRSRTCSPGRGMPCERSTCRCSGGARVAGGHRRCGRGGRGPIGYTKSAAEAVTG